LVFGRVVLLAEGFKEGVCPGLMGLGSLAMAFVGLSGYWRSSRLVKMLETETVEAKELTV